MMNLIKAPAPILVLILFVISISHVFAADTKVVVIPMESSSDNVPGNIKTISVSSVTGALSNTSGADIARISGICGHTGMIKNGSGTAFINVPVQLPDNATITSFSGIFCMNANENSIGMWLVRSDGGFMAQVFPLTSASITPRKRTDSSISSPVVDNENYAYYIQMELTGDSGENKYPISAHITLE